MRIPRAGGGWHAILYTWRKAREAGGLLRMWRAMRTRNACKTCALGMGGQRGGMVNEAGHFPEVCKKSLQAQAADMQPGLRAEFFERTPITELARMTPRQLERLGRLRQPLYAAPGASHYRPIEWEEAFTRIAAQLRAIRPEQSFWYFSGRSSNEAGFLTQLFARRFGTNNINNCSYYCHQASGVGLKDVLGLGTATVRLDDLERSDLVLLIGANPASNHPRFMRTLLGLRRRGGRCIVVNPLRERGLERFSVPSDWRSLLGGGSRIADTWIQPHIGGDRALLAGIGKALLERGAVDSAWLAAHCTGHEALLASLRDLAWETIVTRSGVERAAIEEVAAAYAASRATVFAWAMGVTHHADGVETVRAIAALACLRGMPGRPGAGLLPLRGHSNVQGMGSMGVTPALASDFFHAVEDQLGIVLPTAPGLDTLACMETAAADRIRFAWCLGGNLYGANPDAAFAGRALAAIDQVVHLNTTLNTGHAHGRGRETLILPVLARDEEPEATTQESMFSLVRISDGGRRRHVGPLSEIQVLSAVATRVLPDDPHLDWQALGHAAAIRALIARVVPGYADIGAVDADGREFHVPDRHPAAGRFPTADGRAQLHPIALRPRAPGLHLMTLRSEGQFNTVVYEEEDRYRGQERRDVILLAREDRLALGLDLDQAVTVRSATGSLGPVLVREIAIRPGNAAMYYPEANVLVPRTVDPASRTPAFKDVVVTIEAVAPVA